MTPKRTMMIAQQLYEGIDISGQGTIGIITYMRTDSLRVSQEAQEAAKSFILNRYGSEYYPKSPRVFKTKKVHRMPMRLSGPRRLPSSRRA